MNGAGGVSKHKWYLEMSGLICESLICVSSVTAEMHHSQAPI